ncbi:Di-copper centre-containing protein, partial [Zopfia rhizophila CBS 207.26]
KLAYIEAEKCLMKLPAKLGLEGVRTRFDELQQVHVLQTEMVHGVGAFLPFHRFFMHAHEHLLKTECNYTAGQPYWDESLDAGNFSRSIVLDPETGFGGDGIGTDRCIKDGPFKDYVNAIGPGRTISDHCIDRRVDDCTSQLADRKYVDECMQMRNFSTLWPCIESAPHSAGHGGIGGEASPSSMLNVFSSPGDPLFYLHHTYLDKLWWEWQVKDFPTRLTDIAGPNVGQFPFIPGDLGFVEKVVSVDGDPGNVTTLGHVLTVYGAVPNVTIKDVMDIQDVLLCYEYV